MGLLPRSCIADCVRDLSHVLANRSADTERLKFNDLAKRSGFSGFVEKMGIKNDASGFLADLTKWFVRLIVLVTAFDAGAPPAGARQDERTS